VEAVNVFLILAIVAGVLLTAVAVAGIVFPGRK
jgi:hypothetical protein